jgi:hypothetical protein
MRPRVAGTGDPRIAWGVLGGLAILLLMVLVTISYSNSAKTLADETVAIQAEADQKKAKIAAVPVSVDTVGEEVVSRTLLVGGLAQVRFPWDDAMHDLSESIPSDVTLETMSGASSGTSTTNPDGSVTPPSPTLMLGGCASGWVGYSRFLTWLRQVPGVASVKSNTSTVGTAAGSQGDSGADTSSRTENCGPAPLNFNLTMSYRARSADLVGLPKPATVTPAGATGAAGTPPAVAPAAATTPGAGG